MQRHGAKRASGGCWGRSYRVKSMRRVLAASRDRSRLRSTSALLGAACPGPLGSAWMGHGQGRAGGRVQGQGEGGGGQAHEGQHGGGVPGRVPRACSLSDGAARSMASSARRTHQGRGTRPSAKLPAAVAPWNNPPLTPPTLHCPRARVRALLHRPRKSIYCTRRSSRRGGGTLASWPGWMWLREAANLSQRKRPSGVSTSWMGAGPGTRQNRRHSTFETDLARRYRKQAAKKALFPAPPVLASRDILALHQKPTRQAPSQVTAQGTHVSQHPLGVEGAVGEQSADHVRVRARKHPELGVHCDGHT